jgi:hypothetical protein
MSTTVKPAVTSLERWNEVKQALVVAQESRKTAVITTVEYFGDLLDNMFPELHLQLDATFPNGNGGSHPLEDPIFDFSPVAEGIPGGPSPSASGIYPYDAPGMTVVGPKKRRLYKGGSTMETRALKAVKKIKEGNLGAIAEAMGIGTEKSRRVTLAALLRKMSNEGTLERHGTPRLYTYSAPSNPPFEV